MARSPGRTKVEAVSSLYDGKQIGNFGSPSRVWSKIVGFGDPPEGRGLYYVSGQPWGILAGLNNYLRLLP